MTVRLRPRGRSRTQRSRRTGSAVASGGSPTSCGCASKKSSVTGPLPLGSRIHKALEMYYNDESDLLEAHQSLVDEDRIGLLLDGFDTAELDDEAELGRIMLEGYLEWVATEGLDADLRVLGVEEILKYPMLNGAVTLIGKLDLRMLKVTENLRLVLDFKTAQTFNIHNDTAFLSTQLKTYQVLDMLLERSEATGRGWDVPAAQEGQAHGQGRSRPSTRRCTSGTTSTGCARSGCSSRVCSATCTTPARRF